MLFPAVDLFPGPGLFPGSAQPIGFGGYTTMAEIALSGLVLTQDDPDTGLEWITEQVTGWLGSPASSLQLTQKARAAGSWTSPRNLQSRTLTLSGRVFAPTNAALVAAGDQLNAAVGVDAGLLTVGFGQDVRTCIVYRQDVVLFDPITPYQASWSVQLAAPDPRKFAAATSGSTGLPSVSGGLTFPIRFPISFASSVTSGRVQLTNPGNASAPVVVQINGPVVGPSISHVGSGQTLTFRSALSLGPSDFVVIDMEAQTVLAQGDPNATRAAWVQRALPDFGWLSADPGDNEFAFNAVSGSGTAQVWQVPAWL